MKLALDEIWITSRGAEPRVPLRTWGSATPLVWERWGGSWSGRAWRGGSLDWIFSRTGAGWVGKVGEILQTEEMALAGSWSLEVAQCGQEPREQSLGKLGSEGEKTSKLPHRHQNTRHVPTLGQNTAAGGGWPKGRADLGQPVS